MKSEQKKKNKQQIDMDIYILKHFRKNVCIMQGKPH